MPPLAICSSPPYARITSNIQTHDVKDIFIAEILITVTCGVQRFYMYSQLGVSEINVSWSAIQNFVCAIKILNYAQIFIEHILSS